ncbi:hypothetical protein JCM17846_00440 [Iodidimonas nitroreducens]|uniref:DUF1491 family protein n=1 Tax=Iodidimonas nitroreducens TaxID=1236968 RepID=A0A5A7N251_9PROT|nr:DUF1491 family protein [Iodidimonas nitroreducens]GAK34895.1 hypothetical protein AQ1_02804 [alpha proteobacterium Q-1]GER02362.1 hypothetical protein JCM17846_00440 [Iodidimonas nitroreducens]
MLQPRLKAELWVKAHIRRCQVAGLDAFLRHRGDRDAGTVLLKINGLGRGSMLLEPIIAMDGGRAWMKSSGPRPADDALIEGMIEKRLQRDSDLWVLEIEDPKDRHELDDPIL